MDASSEVTYAYGEDTWAFPLEVGSEGREEVKVSVESSTETRGFGVVVRNDTAFQASATLRHRVEGEGSVVTPAGEFPVVTVRSEFQTADPRLTEFLLAGATVEVSSWSGEVGAPVRSELRHTGGSRVAVLELMEHRYQAAEASLLLGLSPQLLLGIAGSGAAVAAVLLLLLRRRRAPTAPADDVPPAEPGGPERE